MGGSDNSCLTDCLSPVDYGIVRHMDVKQNPYETAARLQKANRLAEVMRANGWDKPYLIEAMTEDHWGTIAKAAGVNSPSQATRDLVVDSLRRSQTPLAPPAEIASPSEQ